MELEVTRVHVDVCITESHRWGRTSPGCWRTCLALGTARSKRKRWGLGLSVTWESTPKTVIELLEEHSLSEKLLVSSFEGVLVGFVFFLLPLGSEGIMEQPCQHAHGSREVALSRGEKSKPRTLSGQKF